MKQGCYVTNPKTPDLGTGKVIKVDGRYITVFYETVGEDRDYPTSDNPLVKVNQKPKEPGPRQPGSGSTASLKLSGLSPGSPESRAKRDEDNARKAKQFAEVSLRGFTRYKDQPDFTRGPSREAPQEERYKQLYADIEAIIHTPFHAMAEVETETLRNGIVERKKQLFYANEKIRTNQPLCRNGYQINVLAWTHPGIQFAMSGAELGEEIDIREREYTLRSIKPLARARFYRVLPSVAGFYEPGGSIGEKEVRRTSSGLRAVKLQMTREQINAFLSKMSGMMLVSGAPGSGKTTVAMQRIRFLLDQQDLRVNADSNVRYSTELTKIFLANENLISYSKEMLEKDLQIPSSVVESIDTFIARHLNEIWAFKHNAALRRKKLFPLEERARLAFFGLCSVAQLQDCWHAFEMQIAERFGQARQASWVEMPQETNGRIAAQKLASSLKGLSSTQIDRFPLGSRLTMDTVYGSVRKEYESLRGEIQADGGLERFDGEFQKWLFWVYDPFDAVVSYFSEEMYEGAVRIKKGTAARVEENVILEAIRQDWANRSYGKEEIPWLAFLLRFVLPEVTDQRARFREMPNPLAIAGAIDDQRWTHVMIDEAQDLCVAQAALLGSFVHPGGAFTVSADFKQTVSPVWGMENPDAFKVGISLRDKGVYQTFPFAKNMRQSKQIGLFLQSFYQSVFGEIAPFEVNKEMEGPRPLLFIGNSSDFAARILQRLNVLRRNPAIRSIALLQVNEDETAMNQMRGYLEALGVELAPMWAATDNSGRLITTSVERIKGLEFDACFVIGMDDEENRTLNFTKSRAYVALSRPATQLTIFCTEIPMALQKVEAGLMEVFYL